MTKNLLPGSQSLKSLRQINGGVKIKKTAGYLTLILAGLILSVANVKAGVFTAKISGDWDNATVWHSPATTGAIPGADDEIIINPGVVLTVNSNLYSCLKLTFKSSVSSSTTSKLIIAPTLANFIFKVKGDILVESSVSDNNNSTNNVILEGSVQAVNLDIKGDKNANNNRISKLTVNPGAKLILSGNATFTGSQTSNAYLDVQGDATLEIAGNLGGGSGNLNFNAASNPGSTIAFTGGPTQSIPSGGGLKYGKLKIANSMSFSFLDDRNFDATQVIIGAGTVSVSGDVKVDKINLLVEGGTLRLTGSSSNFTGVSTTNYIKLGENGGLMIDNIGPGTGNRTSTVHFPVGTSASNSYTPATILNTGTAQSFTVSLSDIVTKPGTIVTDNIVNKTWNITPSGTGANTTLTVQWNTTDEAQSFVRGNCAISHWDDATGYWEQNGVSFGQASQGVMINNNGTTSNLTNSWRISRSNVASFSPFAVGDANSPLPVELTSFTAVKKENGTVLTWETASEKNNKGFEVQASADGKNFETIGSVVTKNSNANYSQRYEFTDKASRSGLVYYRLKQTDLDGTVAYFAAKVVEMGRFASAVTAYPNPFQNYFEVKVNGATALEVTDLSGKSVFRGQASEGAIKVDLSSKPAGIYLLKMTSNGEYTISRLVKQ